MHLNLATEEENKICGIHDFIEREITQDLVEETIEIGGVYGGARVSTGGTFGLNFRLTN